VRVTIRSGSTAAIITPQMADAILGTDEEYLEEDANHWFWRFVKPKLRSRYLAQWTEMQQVWASYQVSDLDIMRFKVVLIKCKRDSGERQMLSNITLETAYSPPVGRTIVRSSILNRQLEELSGYTDVLPGDGMCVSLVYSLYVI
jgi:hypothetical protein